METRLVSGGELVELAHRITREAVDNRDPLAFLAVAILVGDRIRCCDEGIVFADEASRGLATISSEGEGYDGTPTIVGVWIRASDRRRGCGVTLLEAAIRRCIERGFTKIRLDAITHGGKRIIAELPAELQRHLDIHNVSTGLPF